MSFDLAVIGSSFEIHCAHDDLGTLLLLVPATKHTLHAHLTVKRAAVLAEAATCVPGLHRSW